MVKQYPSYSVSTPDFLSFSKQADLTLNTQPELSVLEALEKGLLNKEGHFLPQSEDISKLMEHFVARVAAKHNSFTPLYSLPTELWVHIVKLGQPTISYPLDPPRPIHRLELQASHISRRWREIVIGAPMLWIDIGWLKGRFIDLYLERSRQCSISITLCKDMARLEQIAPHIHRVAELTLNCQGKGTHNLDRFSHLLSHLHAPYLRVLRIHGNREYKRFSFLTAGAPLLSVLDIHNCLPQDSSGLLNFVTTFRHSFTPEPMHRNAFNLSLTQMTSLTELELYVPRDFESVGLQPIKIPWLRSLVLNCTGFPDDDIPLELLILAPDLERLSITRCHADQVTRLFNLLGESSTPSAMYPRLRSLSFCSRFRHGFDDICMPPPFTAKTIEVFQSITELSLIGICWTSWLLSMFLYDIARTARIAPKVAFPQLRTLAIYPLNDPSDNDSAMHVLERDPKEPTAPLSQLRIAHDDLLTLPDGVTMGKWAREQMYEVETYTKLELYEQALICGSVVGERYMHPNESRHW